ncbi:MAG: hypothetical protein V5A45_06160 [Haloarculaceae archaeon]
MEPDLWTTFVFFGIPLVVGLLGVRTGGKLCYRAYIQYTTSGETEWSPVETSHNRPESGRSWRGNLLRGVPILVVAMLLTLQSTRWILRVFGLP